MIKNQSRKRIESYGFGEQCICPKCGHIEPYEVGISCLNRRCPICGSIMAGS